MVKKVQLVLPEMKVRQETQVAQEKLETLDPSGLLEIQVLKAKPVQLVQPEMMVKQDL
jgi:hypothetical protein